MDTKKPPSNWKRKSFSDYLSEFLVISFAVTIGFLADNYRESLSDNAKELNYAKNMVRDLTRERMNVLEAIKKNERIVIALDTFVKIRALNFDHKANADLLLKLFAETEIWSLGIIKPNETTLNQIKSAGGFNVIRPKIADLIAELDMSFQTVKWNEKFSYTHSEETFRMIYELTDYPALWDENPEMPAMVTNDKLKLLKLFNLSADVMWTIEGYNDGLKDHLKVIDKVAKELEGEYHLNK